MALGRFQKGKLGPMEKAERPGEEINRTILPQTPDLSLHARLLTLFLKEIVSGES